MSDCLTCIIGIIGVVVGIGFVIEIYRLEYKKENFLDPIKNKEEKEYFEKLEKLPIEPIYIDLLLKDYETYNKDVERRENITLVIGSLLLGSSFLIIGQTVSQQQIKPNPIAAFASIILYIIWLTVLHYTTRIYEGFAYTRIRTIEKALTLKSHYDFGIHTFLNKKRPTRLLFKLRTSFWQILLIALSVFWFLIGYYY